MNTILKIPNRVIFPYKHGLIAGVCMALVLLTFQLIGYDYKPFLKLVKYIPLTIVLGVALYYYKHHYKKRIFFKGMNLGLLMSMTSGVVLFLINLLLYSIDPEISFSKYGLQPHTMGELLIISFILFFETTVFGSIISFTILQYLKEGGVADK